MARTQAVKRKPQRKKQIEAEESSWFNKSVFWAMFFVACASSITACSLLTQQLKSEEVKTVTMPEDSLSSAPDGHIHLENNLGQALINTHLMQHHQVGDLEKVFKCSNLNGKIYTCKVIESVPVKKPPKDTLKKTEKSPEEKKPEPEPEVEPEFIDEAAPLKPQKKKWEPFK